MIRHRVCITNQKGGVGKTTTAVNLGSFLARQNLAVLLVDNDPQSNATSSLGTSAKDDAGDLYQVLTGRTDAVSACRPTMIPNLDLLPSNPNLAALEFELRHDADAELRLARELAGCQTRYNYIVIDNPPSLGLLAISGMVAADLLVVPVQCEYLALEGVAAILDSVRRVRQSLNPDLSLAGFLLTLFDARTRLSREVVEEMRRHFPEDTYETVIPRAVRLAEAPSHGLPAVLYDPVSSGTLAYQLWTAEFRARIERGANTANPPPAPVHP